MLALHDDVADARPHTLAELIHILAMWGRFRDRPRRNRAQVLVAVNPAVR